MNRGSPGCSLLPEGLRDGQAAGTAPLAARQVLAPQGAVRVRKGLSGACVYFSWSSRVNVLKAAFLSFTFGFSS